MVEGIGAIQVRERLHKVLAELGVASRRRAEVMIAQGEVTVNGHLAQIGQTVDRDRDAIAVRGEPLRKATRRIYLALHKPRGYVTTVRSARAEHTVLELVGSEDRIFPVGRLDKETSGLLLLTNDGDWANLVMHPRYGIEKQYMALVEGRVIGQTIQRLAAGVQLPDGHRTAPAQVRRAGGDGHVTRLSITVIEGRKRQVRLMCAAVGHAVIELVRVRIGPVALGDLLVGEWRRLRSDEVAGIREQATRNAAQREVRDAAADRHRRPGRSR
jgi:23S rRNA pseudouridine2605 synthase